MQMCSVASSRSTAAARQKTSVSATTASGHADFADPRPDRAWFEICAIPSAMRDQRPVLHDGEQLSSSEHVIELPTHQPTRLGRVFDQFGRLLCHLRGHDMLPQFSSNRLFLKCMTCGHESPGWQMAGAHPVVRFQGDHKRHVVERLPAAILQNPVSGGRRLQFRSQARRRAAG